MNKDEYIKVKVRALDIAPLRSESPPQKRSCTARVLNGFHSFTCTPTRSSAIGMSHSCHDNFPLRVRKVKITRVDGNLESTPNRRRQTTRSVADILLTMRFIMHGILPTRSSTTKTSGCFSVLKARRGFSRQNPILSASPLHSFPFETSGCCFPHTPL